MAIDKTNKQFVGIQGNSIVVLMPQSVMTPEEALTHAAYLVCLAEAKTDLTFEDVRIAVENV